MSTDFETDETPCPYPDYAPTERDLADLPNTGADATGVERRVWDAVYEVEDPEMPISVVDLGLVYGIEVAERDGNSVAFVEMTLTYTGCPARDMLTDEVAEAAATAEGVEDAAVVLVFSPPWSVEMVTERGREDLREFGLSVPEAQG